MNRLVSPHRVRLLVWKEFLQLRRDPMLLRALIIMPVLQLILFGYVVAADITHLSTAIVDLDHSTVSRALTSSFTSSQYFDVNAYPASENNVQPLLDSGQETVAIVIPEGTSAALQRGETAPIGIIVDGSNSQLSQVAGSYASQVVASFNQTLLAQSGMAPILASAPGINASIRVEYNPTMAPLTSMIPALMAVILMISLMAIMSMAVVGERESGTLEQMFVTPIRPGEYLIGKVLPYALLACVQTVIVAAGGLLWFRVPFNGNVAVVAVGLILFMLVCIALGLLISLISTTRAQAQQAMMFVMIPTIVLSGFVFPLESMPVAFQWIANVIPLTHALEIIRAGWVKGSGFASLARPFLFLTGFAVVLFTGAVVATRRRLTR